MDRLGNIDVFFLFIVASYIYGHYPLCFLQEEKANAEKKLRALRSELDDRDTTITLLTEELNDTRAAVEALEEELTEYRSKQVSSLSLFIANFNLVFFRVQG